MAIGNEGAQLVEGVNIAIRLYVPIVERVEAHITAQGITVIDHESQIILTQHPLAREAETVTELVVIVSLDSAAGTLLILQGSPQSGR